MPNTLILSLYLLKPHLLIYKGMVKACLHLNHKIFCDRTLAFVLEASSHM